MSVIDQLVTHLFNSTGITFPRGAIVRAVPGSREGALAQADTLTNVQGIVGIAVNGAGGGRFSLVPAGPVPVILVPGLTPVSGQTVYVSASTPGFGTTVAPSNALPIGTIIDASSYGQNSTVLIELDIQPLTAAAPPVANWSDIRFFLLDNEAGSDANLGYVDASEDADLSAVAPSVAIRTIERLQEIFPALGANRRAIVILKARSDAGQYLGPDGVTPSSWIFNTPTYGGVIVRGTATQPTAGSVAFRNDEADKRYCGARIAPGTAAQGYRATARTSTISGATAGSPITITTSAPHGLVTGDSVWISGVRGITGANGRYLITVVDPTTFTLNGSNGTGTWISGAGQQVFTWQVVQADGSPAGFTQDLASTAIVGLRIRFDAASAHPNVIRDVWSNGATSIIPTAPVTGLDPTAVFYLESPGVQVDRVAVTEPAGAYGIYATSIILIPTSADLQLVGIHATRGLTVSRGATNIRVAFCQTPTFVARDSLGVTIADTFTALTSTGSFAVGGVCVGDRAEALASQFVVERIQFFTFNNLHCVRRAGTFDCRITNVGVLQSSFRNTFARGLRLVNIGFGCGSISGALINSAYDSFLGLSGTTDQPTRIYGVHSVTTTYGLIFQQSILSSQGLTIENTPIGIAVGGNGARLQLAGVVGSNNTQYGLTTDPREGVTFQTGACENVVVVNQANLVYGLRGALGAFAVAARIEGAAFFQAADFETNAITDLVDTQGNRLRFLRRSLGVTLAPRQIQVQRTAAFAQATGSTLPAYRVVKATTTAPAGGPARVVLAQANSFANASGVVGLSMTPTANNDMVLVVPAGEEGYVEFDRSGGRPAPTLGAVAYLSTATPGLAQANLPSTGGTDQLVQLGTIIAIHPTNTDVAAIQFSPQRPVLA